MVPMTFASHHQSCTYEDAMSQPCPGESPKAAFFNVRSAWAPASCLIALLGALAYSLDEPKTLDATTRSPNSDFDTDGLIYQQEYLLGTDDDTADTDIDGYSDLEEIARGSDPLEPGSVPSDQDYSSSVFAYSQAGFLHFQAAVYVKNADTNGLRLEAGFVGKQGQSFVFGPDVIATASFNSKRATNAADLLIMMNLPIPESFITKLGQLNLFVRLVETGSTPGSTTGAGSASTMTVVASAGTMMQVQFAPVSVNEGDGVIYRPLTGPNDPAPSTAATGQVCWQNTFPVATNGNLIQFQILSASCQDFDAFCDATACSASAGDSVDLVDPSSLLGG